MSSDFHSLCSFSSSPTLSSSTLFYFLLLSLFSFPFCVSLSSNQNRKNDPVLCVRKPGINLCSSIKFILKITVTSLCFGSPCEKYTFPHKYRAWYIKIARLCGFCLVLTSSFHHCRVCLQMFYDINMHFGCKLPLSTAVIIKGLFLIAVSQLYMLKWHMYETHTWGILEFWFF